MANLLTAKQVQELLHVDRTTIYRMLKDGRLNGIKVGSQWRFSEEQVEALLSGKEPEEEISPEDLFEALPIHCMQPMQDVFAEIAGVGAVIVDKEGLPLTRISNSCDFCKLILGSTDGRKKCFASWKNVVEQAKKSPEFVYCHAGLRYAIGNIKADEEVVASFIAGQFHTESPNLEAEKEKARELAQKYGINPDLLARAVGDVAVYEDEKKEKIGSWLQRIADTFGDISVERADLLTRLKTISKVSGLD
jgi:excisionase family DNA binding protein